MRQRPKRILFIDDETIDPAILERAFPECCIHWASSIRRGHQMLEDFEPFDLVLVDYNGTSTYHMTFDDEIKILDGYNFFVVSGLVLRNSNGLNMVDKNHVTEFVKDKLGL